MTERERQALERVCAVLKTESAKLPQDSVWREKLVKWNVLVMAALEVESAVKPIQNEIKQLRKEYGIERKETNESNVIHASFSPTEGETT